MNLPLLCYCTIAILVGHLWMKEQTLSGKENGNHGIRMAITGFSIKTIIFENALLRWKPITAVGSPTTTAPASPRSAGAGVTEAVEVSR